MNAIKKAQAYLDYLSLRGIRSLPKGTLNVIAKSDPKGLQEARATETSRQQSLEELKAEVLPCTLCPELARTRKSVVFGSGNPNAKLMFVGEAPGFDEDVEGLPFVGKAGQLLTKIIESIGLKRSEVYIANVLKCRPPGNRNPFPEEVIHCHPYLKKQIAMIRPRVICALGNFAAQTLLSTASSITRLRGNWHSFEGVKVMPTFHPAYLLRNPLDKRKVWEDMKMIRDELHRS